MAGLQVSRSSIVSEIQDNNIFHFLSREILNLILLSQYKGIDFSTTTLVLEKFIDGNTTNAWRLEVLKLMGFQRIILGAERSEHLAKYIYRIPEHTKWVIDGSPSLGGVRYNGFFAESFRNMKVSAREQIDLLFVVRSGSRILFDTRTGQRAENCLAELSKEFNVTFRSADLDTLPPSDQFTLFRSARSILAVHGAGLTNIVFCSPEARIWELNFRQLFPCDPLCDDHFHSIKSYKTQCNGTRIHDEFHKLDYIKLSTLFGLGYTELEIEECCDPLCRNPISVRSVFGDVRRVFEQIHDAR